ncbi:hypothetical protein C5E07_16605 [Pseudoclavibacter sp. RFBJ3]|uniref:hypothetical protein n=1 Tax=unclassified Pseudoclavibacter TaxID=2615177 RepID=UPI000CE76C4C|nr:MULTISPECIES: hypothetical protein [unclassified Pseudoclavibacter]PPF87557.1 hypothetical protein C5C12_00415 [Pseudoclavibacter sp. RFBJ5]PPF90407.1 hypothetical protein C5E07_16605 [Pseudoclavibacter sp. RFBJ3]PPG01092.1 hypothetical protein C5C19_00415 [Pseudoclavibacter sp. RFBH5]PPG26195.1 hypothetical protein C5E13_00370 [Pseudoclavibacter sp. RFBI4]
MSAIMLAPEHFNVLIWTAIHAAPAVPSERNLVTYTTAESTPYNGVRSWGAAGNVRELTAGTETIYGQMLVDANAAAVNDKYGEDNAYVYAYSRPKSTEWTPREVLSALDGFEYQACEVEDWVSSEAKQFCDILRRRLERRIIGNDDGPWIIGADTLPALVEERHANMRRRGIA